MAESPEYGHIKISRKAFLAEAQGGDRFWNEPRTFSRWEAWEYLIQAAAWSDHEWAIPKGPVIRVVRGETKPLSYDFLARAWRWTPKQVRLFVATLLSMDQIRAQQLTPQGHTYFVVNYELYQGEGQGECEEKGKRRAERGQSEGKKEKQYKQKKQLTDSIGAWSRRACDLWLERFNGTVSGERIGKALKPLVAKHEAAPVLEAWQRYLHGQDAKYASPENFAAKYGEWAKPANGMNGRKPIDDYTYTPTDEFPGWAK